MRPTLSKSHFDSYFILHSSFYSDVYFTRRAEIGPSCRHLRDKDYFLANEDEWKMRLQAVKEYIEKEKKRPPKSSKDEAIKRLG